MDPESFQVVKNVIQIVADAGKAISAFVDLGRKIDSPSPEPTENAPQRVVILPGRHPNFVNRENELSQIKKILQESKYLHIRGLGGIGKTYLAIEAAYQMQEKFPDGIVWLSTIDYPTNEDVLNGLAAAFGIQHGQMSLLEEKMLIQKMLASKCVLLILDNAEIAEPAQLLLEICGMGAVIVTSRPPLMIPGFKSLDVPVLTPENAQRLFMAICQRNLSPKELALAEEIFQKTIEGYPLAIELAAKQVQVQQIDLATLANQIEKRTLDFLALNYLGNIRTPLLSTFNQLDQRQQNLFASLSVFSGRTFSAEAATFVSALENAKGILHQLAAYSLIIVEEERYTLHPLLKQFARENLQNSDSVYQRLVTYFQDYVQRRCYEFSAIEIERINILGALDWSVDRGNHQAIVSIVGSLLTDDAYYGFFAQRGYWTEGVKRINQAIQSSQALSDQNLEASFSLALGLFHYWHGAYQDARKAYQTARLNFDKVGNLRGQIRACWQTGYIEDDEDNYAEASRLYQNSLDLSLKLGDAHLISTSRELVGVVEYHRGNYDLARPYLEQSIKECKMRNDIIGISRANRRLAAVARRQAVIEIDKQKSQTYLDEAYKLLVQCLKVEKSRRSIARARRQMGMVLQAQGDLSSAKTCYEFSLKISRELNNKKDIAAALYNLGTIEETEGNIDQAEKLYSESLNLGKLVGVKMGIALNLRQLGCISSKRGSYQAARKYLNEALKILDLIYSPYAKETQEMLAIIEKNEEDHVKQRKHPHRS